MKKRQQLRDFVAESDKDFERVSEFFSDNINDDELLTQILKEGEDAELTFGQRMADKVAAFGGSWAFILSFLAMMAIWIVANSLVLYFHPFDPYPFILLNLVLSCLASLQAPIIMMSQNRQEEKDRQRAQHDYLINLKAEMEIRNIQINMKNLFEIQKKQMEMLNNLKKN